MPPRVQINNLGANQPYLARGCQPRVSAPRRRRPLVLPQHLLGRRHRRPHVDPVVRRQGVPHRHQRLPQAHQAHRRRHEGHLSSLDQRPCNVRGAHVRQVEHPGVAAGRVPLHGSREVARQHDVVALTPRHRKLRRLRHPLLRRGREGGPQGVPVLRPQRPAHCPRAARQLAELLHVDSLGHEGRELLRRLQSSVEVVHAHRRHIHASGLPRRGALGEGLVEAEDDAVVGLFVRHPLQFHECRRRVRGGRAARRIGVYAPQRAKGLEIADGQRLPKVQEEPCVGEQLLHVLPRKRHRVALLDDLGERRDGDGGGVAGYLPRGTPPASRCGEHVCDFLVHAAVVDGAPRGVDLHLPLRRHPRPTRPVLPVGLVHGTAERLPVVRGPREPHLTNHVGRGEQTLGLGGLGVPVFAQRRLQLHDAADGHAHRVASRGRGRGRTGALQYRAQRRERLAVLLLDLLEHGGGSLRVRRRLGGFPPQLFVFSHSL